MLFSHERLVLILGVSVMFFSYIIYSAVIPIFPKQAEECAMNPVHIGVVVGTFPIGMFTASLITGRFLPILGAKIALMIGLVIAIIGSLLFGSVPYFLCEDTFDVGALCLFILSRFIQGAAAGIIETTVLYAMSVVFSDQLGEMVAYQETAIGLALMVGPLLGGGLFAAVGFFYTFVVICAIQFCVLVVIGILFPKVLDLDEIEYGNDLLEEEIEEVKLTSALGFSTLTTCIVIFACAFLFNSQEVIVPVYLEQEREWTPLKTGLLFSAASLLYAIFAIMVGKYLDARENKTTHIYKCSFLIGFALMAFGFYVISPYPLDVTIPSLSIGVCFIGAGFAFSLTPSLPDAQLCAEVHSGSKRKEYQSFMSSLWLAFFSAATATGSPFIGFLYEEIGFSITMHIYSGISLTFAILMGLYINFGPA